MTGKATAYVNIKARNEIAASLTIGTVPQLFCFVLFFIYFKFFYCYFSNTILFSTVQHGDPSEWLSWKPLHLFSGERCILMGVDEKQAASLLSPL